MSTRDRYLTLILSDHPVNPGDGEVSRNVSIRNWGASKKDEQEIIELLAAVVIKHFIASGAVETVTNAASPTVH